jgi:hypothetical protein
MERRYSAFTVTSQTGLLNVLKTDCLVSQAWHPSSGIPQPEMVPFTGIWDTGATNSAISQEVVDKCGLVPTGTTLTHNVGGTYQFSKYALAKQRQLSRRPCNEGPDLWWGYVDWDGNYRNGRLCNLQPEWQNSFYLPIPVSSGYRLCRRGQAITWPRSCL